MEDRVDLHVHSSKSSDGDFTPFHLLKLTREHGLRAISICDHDTVEAYPEAMEWSFRLGVELIPSVEMTTLFDGREFHCLLPFIHWESKFLKKILGHVRRARMEEAAARLSRLQELGFAITLEEVQKKAGAAPPLGVTIAQVLIDKGEKQQVPALEKYYRRENRFLAPYAFYKDYFLEGGPAFVPKKTVSLVDVLELVSRDGAVPVLAHPGAYFERATREDLLVLKEKGLVGLEVYSSYHTQEQTVLYKALAEEIGFVATAGSDFHGRIKPHIPFGFIKEGTYAMVEELKKRRR